MYEVRFTKKLHSIYKSYKSIKNYFEITNCTKYMAKKEKKHTVIRFRRFSKDSYK